MSETLNITTDLDIFFKTLLTQQGKSTLNEYAVWSAETG